MTRISKPAPPGCGFRSAPSPTGAVSKRASRSATGGGPGVAPGSPVGATEAGGYAEHRLGTTDDLQDADGVAVLGYGQAQKAARAWWRAELRREEGHDTRTGPYTVADAVADYLKEFERRGGKSVYHTRRAAETHILPSLGTALVAKLTAKKIEDWHHGLADKPALARTKPGRKPNHRKADKSADGVRKRRATANRILTVLKAALNHAWKSGHVASDDAWRRVKPFRAVETARVRYLSEAECVRLVNACEPAFRNLVRGALLTGCRYSELTTMHVADFNADAGVVTIRESKAGKPRHVVLTNEGQRLFARLTAGKLGDDPIFTAPTVARGASRTNCGRCWKRARARRSSRRFHSMCFAIRTARRSPCAACRWASSPNSSATPIRA